MGANHDTTHLSPEEKKYSENMTTGDDFLKIEIFRSAEACYRRALEARPGDELAKEKLAGTMAKIKKENSAIYAIVSVAAVVVLLVVIFT